MALFIIVSLITKVVPVFHCVYISLCYVHIMLSFATTEHYWTVGNTVRFVHVYICVISVVTCTVVISVHVLMQ